MKKYRPFLKWAGNKYRCLEHILSTFPRANRLIEPFTGSAAIFLNSDHPEYLLGEENQDLILLYQYVKQEGEAFIDFCEHYFTSLNNQETQYYSFREQFNYKQKKNSKEHAATFLYLNRHGYNGLCRYNRNGQFNVPFGRYIKPYFPREEMRLFHQKSQSATFIHSDFRKTFLEAKAGDIIYCDPPYVPIHQNSNFSSYTRHKFGEKEQIILAQLAKETAARGIPVIISNHDTEFTRYHYKDAQIKAFEVRRSISCLSNQRGLIKELVAIFC